MVVTRIAQRTTAGNNTSPELPTKATGNQRDMKKTILQDRKRIQRKSTVTVFKNNNIDVKKNDTIC
jgi:hypothetical protein